MTQETRATQARFDPAQAQAITDEVVALLETGTLPWRRPWRTAGGGALPPVGHRLRLKRDARRIEGATEGAAFRSTGEDRP